MQSYMVMQLRNTFWWYSNVSGELWSSGGWVVKLLACGARGPGSIPGLATWIFRDWLSPSSKSRYGWKIAKLTLILKTTNNNSGELYIFLEVVLFRPPFHIQQNKQIYVMFRITNSTLMERIYPKALAGIKIEGVIWVKQMLWAVKVRAKIIGKKPSSLLI